MDCLFFFSEWIDVWNALSVLQTFGIYRLRSCPSLLCRGPCCKRSPWAVITVRDSKSFNTYYPLVSRLWLQDSRDMILLCRCPQAVVRLECFCILLCLAKQALQIEICMRLVVCHHCALEYGTLQTPLIRLIIYARDTWLKLIGLKFCAPTIFITPIDGIHSDSFLVGNCCFHIVSAGLWSHLT